MGDVIRPAFGGRPPQTPQEQPPQEHQEEEESGIELTEEQKLAAQVDLLFMLKNKDYVHGMRDKIERASDFIFSLRNFSPHSANIELRRKGLGAMTVQDLCRIIEQSAESQWREQPSYFGALLLEYDVRVNRALEQMKEHEKK